MSDCFHINAKTYQKRDTIMLYYSAEVPMVCHRYSICNNSSKLTVDDRISCGQHASKKLLQTFGSEYFT